MLSEAAAPACGPVLPEREQRRERCGCRSDIVRERHGWNQRRLGRDARFEHHAAHRLEHRVGRDPVCVRASEPEVRERHVHEMRMRYRDPARREPVSGSLSPVRGLEQHIAAREQRVQLRAACGAREIERGAALVGIAPREVEAHAALQRHERARRCAARLLDAQHVRAEIREQPPTQLAAPVGKIDHANARERAIGGGLGLRHLGSSSGRRILGALGHAVRREGVRAVPLRVSIRAARLGHAPLPRPARRRRIQLSKDGGPRAPRHPE